MDDAVMLAAGVTSPGHMTMPHTQNAPGEASVFRPFKVADKGQHAPRT